MIEAFKQAICPYSTRRLSDEEVTQTFGLNEERMMRLIAKETKEVPDIGSKQLDAVKRMILSKPSAQA